MVNLYKINLQRGLKNLTIKQAVSHRKSLMKKFKLKIVDPFAVKALTIKE